jgi:peptide/nickel transport system ATP-binding protein
MKLSGEQTETPPSANEVLLDVRDLQVSYRTPAGPARAVNGVSFRIRRGERFGIVGESGCGKSTTANAILRLIHPPGGIDGGQILLEGIDLLKLDKEQMRRTRWTRLSLITQGAMNSLNPVMRVRDQIADAITEHVAGPHNAGALDEQIGTLLRIVGLPDRVMRLFPHELSGGMKQRVCIAMAMALDPSLIIADEPTSALDVVVQRVVAQTLIEVGDRLGASLILIGHDIGLQAQLVHRLAVMYAGFMVEVGEIPGILTNPLHPYTQLLTSSVPSIRQRTLPRPIPGLPPSLVSPPSGCIFHPRCPFAKEVCREVTPPPRELSDGRVVACHLY